jgi:hypothetical protein
MKKLLLAAATVIFSLTSEAFAGPISVDSWDSPITVGDKTFTPIDHTSLSSNAFLDIQLSGNSHTGTYSFNIGGLGSVTGGLNGVISYSVTINDPGWYFSHVALDVTSNTATTSVTKDVFADSSFTTLLGSQSSLNGVPGVDINLPTGIFTTLYIRDTVILDASGSISGFSNTYTQSTVPEPGSLALASFGIFNVIGLTMYRRISA